MVSLRAVVEAGAEANSECLNRLTASHRRPAPTEQWRHSSTLRAELTEQRSSTLQRDCIWVLPLCRPHQPVNVFRGLDLRFHNARVTHNTA